MVPTIDEEQNMPRPFLRALSVLSIAATLSAYDVVPHDQAYYTSEAGSWELIYTERNLPFAGKAAAIETELQPRYEATYGYRMDETLYVGLISDYNQIANGFSTQYPNNRQINYDGGALSIDYFSSPSWLETLLYHETAHNYQTNAKDNPISDSLHTVFRNGIFFIPWFTVPNMMESSFMLEGNAVLNESWHGNGGRLYSGRFKAATLQQAKADYLTPERVYNDNYYFLYGSHFYTLGGYYQYYLAERYGLQKTNAYWKLHSRDWFWPFFTNRSLEDAVGADFDTTFEAWKQSMEREAALLKDAEGETVAESQFYTPINGDAERIYFMTNPTGRSFPELVVYDKASGKVTKMRTSHIAGKVLRLTDGRYVTQASAYTSPWRIYGGLYDDEAMPVSGTRSKVVEGYLRDGRQVYFDIPSSFDQPQLYVGNDFYARVNSSVYIDRNDNLYYFVQGNGKERTLYKNKTPLLTIRGYYGNVSGVDSRDAVYFIANTPYGSGLFRYDNGRVTRASSADTVFEARLIDDTQPPPPTPGDDTHALAAVMGTDAYVYKRIPLETIDASPYEVKLFVEDEPYYRSQTDQNTSGVQPEVGLEHPYHSFTAMNYSGTDFAFGIDSLSGVLFNLSANFEDPLTQNRLSFYAMRNANEYTLGGASYTNRQFFLQFSLSAYGVLGRPDQNATQTDDRRDYGIIVRTALPFMQYGRYSAALYANYYQDYESRSREPFSALLNLARSEQYGVSMFPNFLASLSPYAAYDRGDSTFGGEGELQHDLPFESYAGLRGQYSQSDAASPQDSRGVKFTRSQAAILIDGDPTTIVMPSLKSTAYVKSASKGSAEFRKVLNLAAYYFTFPVSLRREALTAGYNRYDIGPFGGGTVTANEAHAGIAFDTYWLNRVAIPLTLDYYYNDNALIAEQHLVRFDLGIVF